jgi:7-cyano-7-deazaguanine synthase
MKTVVILSGGLDSWSCYRGGVKPCGRCGTCLDRRDAFRINGLPDPADEPDIPSSI